MLVHHNTYNNIHNTIMDTPKLNFSNLCDIIKNSYPEITNGIYSYEMFNDENLNESDIITNDSDSEIYWSSDTSNNDSDIYLSSDLTVSSDETGKGELNKILEDPNSNVKNCSQNIKYQHSDNNSSSVLNKFKIVKYVEYILITTKISKSISTKHFISYINFRKQYLSFVTVIL